MNIVVAMKQIPDLQQIRIRQRQPVLDGVPAALGMIDKNSLEAAVLLKEKEGGQVIVLSAGNEEVEETVKEALAAGADQAFLVIDDSIENADGSVKAPILAEAVKRIEDVGLLLFGEGSGDNYSGQLGSRVAELLGWPQVGFASKIEIQGSQAIITRSLEDGDEILEVNLPAVVTVLGDINEPRIPSVTQILKAGRKPKEVLELEELELDLPALPQIKTLSNLAPETNRKQIKVGSVEELIQALKSEGVI
jgi:electron transfer flavoprotein beta subunit